MNDAHQHAQKISTPRRGRPPVTSRSEILAGARRIIDEEGWEALTVRRLAKVLGIGTTTIYHHVRDRDDLLIHLVNDAASHFPRPDLPADPRERIVVTTLAMREALGAMPWAADVLAADGEACLGTPGKDALWFVEEILDSASEAGCTPEQSGDFFLNLWVFTVGELLVRVSGARRKADTSSGSRRSGVLHGTSTFSQGVRALVQGTLDQIDVSSS